MLETHIREPPDIACEENISRRFRNISRNIELYPGPRHSRDRRWRSRRGWSRCPSPSPPPPPPPSCRASSWSRWPSPGRAPAQSPPPPLEPAVWALTRHQLKIRARTGEGNNQPTSIFTECVCLTLLRLPSGFLMNEKTISHTINSPATIKVCLPATVPAQLGRLILWHHRWPHDHKFSHERLTSCLVLLITVVLCAMWC